MLLTVVLQHVDGGPVCVQHQLQQAAADAGDEEADVDEQRSKQAVGT